MTRLHRSRSLPSSRGVRPAVAAVCSALLLGLAACGGSDAEAPEEPSETASVELPDTPVGEAASEAIAALTSPQGLDQDTYARLFSPVFREQVPLEQLAALAGSRIEIGEVRAGAAPTFLSAEADVTGIGPSIFTAGLDEEGLIAQFSVLVDPQPPVPPDSSLGSWEAIDAELADVAPQVSLLAARVGDDGSCTPVHTLDARQSRPLGSTVKLVVLDALAAAVDAGEVAWEDTVTVTDELKTLPSGALQAARGEVEVSVLDAAGLMVSISDNTATDALIDLLGRTAVEEQAVRLGLDVATLRPFLSTAELFWLRLDDYPARAEEYVAASVEERRELLGDSVAKPTPDLDAITGWTDARWRDGPGWQASARELCEVYGALGAWTGAAGEGVAEVLSLNDNGIALNPEQWPSVWFKGGSETGVANLAYRATDPDGTAYVVIVMAADPRQALPEDAVGRLGTLARSGFAQLAAL